MSRKYYRLIGETYLSDGVYSDEVLMYSWSYGKCVYEMRDVEYEYRTLEIEEIKGCDLPFFNWLKEANPVGELAEDLSELKDSYMCEGVSIDDYLKETRGFG